jgi:hypothetical protein
MYKNTYFTLKKYLGKVLHLYIVKKIFWGNMNIAFVRNPYPPILLETPPF